MPLLGWILSSFVHHGVGLALPENGLRGDYELQPYARAAANADAPTPDAIRSGAEVYVGTPERGGTRDEVPAGRFHMEGEQPNELVLSEASGRTLSRTDPLAAWFERAYVSVHVWQWGDDVRLFTALLYGLVGVALTVVLLGSLLWVDRRRRGGLPEGTRTSRKIHGRLAPLAGLPLATRMLVGAYLWYNLGSIEPRFRGQGSFQTEWTGGVDFRDTLASAERLAGPLQATGGADQEAYRSATAEPDGASPEDEWSSGAPPSGAASLPSWCTTPSPSPATRSWTPHC